MVQHFLSDRGPYRPTGVPLKNVNDSPSDDSNGTRSLSITQGAPKAASMPPLELFMDHCNPEVWEIMYRLTSGKVFRITRAHPEAQEIHIEDLPARQPSRASVDVIEGQHCSERGQARHLPTAGFNGRTPKRKRRGSSSPTPALRTKKQSVRRRHTAIKSDHDSDSHSEDEPDEMDDADTEMRRMKVSELHRLYYVAAFRSINQLCCRDISKAWIRVCHPKKQTTHPYNGRETGRRSKAAFGYSGHYTIPDYWPSDDDWRGHSPTGCRHKEPDHVKRPERLILLVHLLRSQYKGFKDGDFSLGNLVRSTEGIHLDSGKHWTTGNVERLNEIYDMRTKEMEYERGEIDGDTLVSVQIPDPRCKVRKAPKSIVKARSPPNEQVKQEPEEKSFTTCHAPMANMRSNVQIEDECVDLSEGSEPSILADTSSSTEEIAPDVSCPEPVLCKARTTGHDLPFSGSPSPTSTRLNSVQDHWTANPTNLGQDPAIFTHPNPFGPVATPSQAPRFLPSCEHYRIGPSSMQSFPSQIGRPQYDLESAASQRVVNRMRPNETFPRNPPAEPIAQEMESVRHPTFAASSTGLVGAFSTDADYSSWQTGDLWNAQLEPSIRTAGATPDISYLLSTNGSFSSGYGDASFSSGLPLETWKDTPYRRGLDEDLQERLNLQTVSLPQHRPLGMETPSGGIPALANPSSYTTDFGTHSSSGTEHSFDPFSQSQRQR